MNWKEYGALLLKASCTQKAGCSCSECVDKSLSPKQKKIAEMAEPRDKIDGADFGALRENTNKAKCPHCDGNAPRSECICDGKHIIKAEEDSHFAFNSKDRNKILYISIDGDYEVDTYDIKLHSSHSLQGNVYREQISHIEGRIDFYEALEEDDGDTMSHEFKIECRDIEADYTVKFSESGMNSVFTLEMNLKYVNLEFKVEGKRLVFKSAQVDMVQEN